MPSKVTLNQVKNNLIKEVETAAKKNKKIFHTKASMNSFINKIVKANSFKKVDEYKSLLDYTIKNNIIYKAKIYKDIKTDVDLSKKLQDEKIEKVINISYKESISNEFSLNKLQEKIVDKMIDLINKKPNNLMKVNIKFINDDKLNGEIEPSQLKNSRKSHLNVLVYWLLRITSDTDKISKYFEKKSNRVYNVKISISSYPKISGYQLSDYYRVIQNFKDSGLDILCVPNAIINYFNNKINKTSDKKTISKYNGIIKKIQEPKYNKPYSIKDLEELSDDINVSFTITDFINEDIKIGAGSNKRYNIVLINTKLHHLENYNNEIIEINENEANGLLDTLTNYIKSGNTIYTKEKTYVINKGEFSKLHHEHMEKFNLDRNYIKANSSESEYINNYYMSTHQIFNNDLFNYYIEEIKKVDELKVDELKNVDEFTYNKNDLDFGLDVESYNPSNEIFIDKLNRIQQREKELFSEIDLRGAYFNLVNESPYGIPSNSFIYYDNGYAVNIDDHIKNKMIGYYTITIIDKSEKIKVIFGENKDNIVLTTPQIITLKNHNIEFNINNCLISPSIPFKFDDSMLRKENELKHYCKSVGIFISQNNHIKKYIKTDNPEEFIKIINNKNNKIDIAINYKNIIEISEDTNASLKHIGFFIHSFTSAEIIEFILNNDNTDDILGVKLDSLIVRKDAKFNYNEEKYKTKEANIYKLVGYDNGFLKPYIQSSNYINNCKVQLFDNVHYLKNRVVLFQGKGGAGKSSDIRKNFEPYEVCYSALAWARGVDFKNDDDYNCSILSLNKLIGSNNCEKIKLNKFCKTIVLDELTLINSSIIDKVINDFPDKRIILIGDIDKDGFNFQCSMSSMDGFQLFHPKNYDDCQMINFTTNYRFDDELNNKLDDLRKFMKLNSHKTNKIELLNEYVKNSFSECYIDKEQLYFSDGYMGISSLQEDKLNFKYTNYFLDKGGCRPIYYNNKTIFNKNIFKGGISYEKPSHNNYDIRLFESVHACQGKTVPSKSLLFIIIEKNFDYQLLYTALSRARSLSQIRIITGF